MYDLKINHLHKIIPKKSPICSPLKNHWWLHFLKMHMLTHKMEHKG